MSTVFENGATLNVTVSQQKTKNERKKNLEGGAEVLFSSLLFSCLFLISFFVWLFLNRLDMAFQRAAYN